MHFLGLFLLSMTPRGGYSCYPGSADEKTEAHKGEETCLWPHIRRLQSQPQARAGQRPLGMASPALRSSSRDRGRKRGDQVCTCCPVAQVSVLRLPCVSSGGRLERACVPARGWGRAACSTVQLMFSLTVNVACPLALTFFESMIVNGCVILTKVVISSVCS